MAGPSRRYNSDDEVDPYVGIDTESALHTLDSRIAELLGFRATIAENRDSDSDADRRMAESMTAAVLSDGPLITTHIREEEVAAHDHRLARRLDDEFKRTRRMTPPTDGDLPPLSSLPCESEMAFLSKIAGLFVSESAARSLLPNNILVAETEANGQLKASHQCTICLDSKTWVEVFQAPCRHEYCGDCIRTLFQESYKDESLFPPRCCKQTIPITGKFLALFLPTSIRNRYATRSIEVTTTDRTYCNKCNTFILPRTTEDNVAVCSACKARTCSKCKRAAHTGDCTTDPAEHKVLRLAKEQGWQRCPGCRAMVDLRSGCNHMTCRCGHQFCYICAAKWKSCRCVAFTLERLLERANQIVDRAPVRAPNAVARRAQVQQVARNLEGRHEGTHPNRAWRRIDGPNDCEECHQTLAQFIFECGQCHLRACRRCRRNRL